MTTNYVVSRKAAIAPLGAGVLRSLRVEFRPICDGRELMSPDGRLIARATSTYGPRLSGVSKSYYEFEVEVRATRLQHVKIPVPREDLINWRLEGSIAWAADSSSVTFDFNRVKVTLAVDRVPRLPRPLPGLCGGLGGRFNEMELDGAGRDAKRQSGALFPLVERVGTSDDQ